MSWICLLQNELKKKKKALHCWGLFVNLLTSWYLIQFCIKMLSHCHPQLLFPRILHFVVAQSLSHVQLLMTPWTAACKCSLSFTISQSLLKGPLSQQCHPIISSSAVDFSCLQSFPASGSFLMSWFFTSGGQSIGASPSASVLPINIQSWFPLGLIDLISLQTLKSLLQHHSSKAPILQHSITFMVQLSYPYRNTGKIIALTTWAFVSKVVWFFFNMLFRFVKVFLPRRKHLLISWWQSLCTVILEPKEIKSVTVSVVSQSIYHKVKGLDSMILVFECWVLSQLFHSLLSPSSRGSLFFFAFCHKGGVICIAEVIGIFPRNLDSSSCFTQASISHYVLCM